MQLTQAINALTPVFEELGFDTVYTYDNIIFPQQNTFIIEVGQEILLFCNSEYNRRKRRDLQNEILEAAKSKSIDIVCSGKYKLKERDDETLEVMIMEN